jgi:hypothetical protein
VWLRAYDAHTFDPAVNWRVWWTVRSGDATGRTNSDDLDRLDLPAFTATFTMNGLLGLTPEVVSSLLRRDQRAA